MITLKQTQKAKINQLVEQYNKAKDNNITSIYEAYAHPSKSKIDAYYNIVDICIYEIKSFDYYIVGYNCNTFSMICKYIKWDDTKKQYKTMLRYWSAYNTYECEVIL